MFLIFDFCFVQVTIALSVYINIVQIVILFSNLYQSYTFTHLQEKKNKLANFAQKNYFVTES